MKRFVLVLPKSLDSENDVFREAGGVLPYLTERSVVNRVKTQPESSVPELAWFGLDPARLSSPQGPITVAALGKEPPPGSVQFHLSLASLSQDTTVDADSDVPAPEEETVLKQALEQLRTKTLTPLWGEALDHALVWESGSLDLGTTEVRRLGQNPLWSTLPEGDGELMLRRLIDDSVNILADLDFNKQRLDEGKRPLNLLWPWGPGFRPYWPNLSIRRGEPVQVESRSLRLTGIANLLGCNHGKRQAFGRPLSVDTTHLLSSIAPSPVTIVVAENLAEAVAAGRVDDAARMLDQLAKGLLGPLFEGKETAVLVLATTVTATSGLSLRYDPRIVRSNVVPFDSRVLEDSRVPLSNDWEVAHDHLRP